MQKTACPYCAVDIRPGAEICSICKHPVPPGIRGSSPQPGRPRARSAKAHVPTGGSAGWDLLAGGAAFFLAMIGVALVLAMV